jgi:hypothetical protein
MKGIVLVFLVALVSGCGISSNKSHFKTCIDGWWYYKSGYHLALVIGDDWRRFCWHMLRFYKYEMVLRM